MTNPRLPIASILILLLAFPAALPAATVAQDESNAPVTEQEATTWEKAEEATGDTVDWTVEKSRQGWEATKTAIGKAVDWVKEKTGSPGQGDAAEQ